jgi:hypothetical protein
MKRKDFTFDVLVYPQMSPQIGQHPLTARDGQGVSLSTHVTTPEKSEVVELPQVAENKSVGT